MPERDTGHPQSSPTTASLAPEELAHFLMRRRRGETLERFDPRLDNFLREILSRANEFVPSESGAILLDDPWVKMFRGPERYLTLVTGFGELAAPLLGRKLAVGEGMVGKVYTSGTPVGCRAGGGGLLQEAAGELPAHSLLGVPVVLGNSICGVLLLINRRGQDSYSEEDKKLIEIFAGYISSSIQNVLDGLRAKELARRDDLTGLFNDRYFHFRLREEINRAEAEGHDVTLLFLDLDHFKDVNDQFGHLEGSRVLHEVGILIASRAPEGAIAARYGGDEFVVILPSYDAQRALEVARQLQELVVEAAMITQRPDHPGPQPQVTASVGVATLHEHVEAGTTAQRANALIRTADAAMYQAKAGGRNQVVMAVAKTKEYRIAAPCRRESADAPHPGTTQPGGRPDPGSPGDLPGATGALRDGSGNRRS